MTHHPRCLLWSSIPSELMYSFSSDPASVAGRFAAYLDTEKRRRIFDEEVSKKLLSLGMHWHIEAQIPIQVYVFDYGLNVLHATFATEAEAEDAIRDARVSTVLEL